MMMNKRLIGTVKESNKYIIGNVAFQWISLGANITMMASITSFLARLFEKTASAKDMRITLGIAVIAILVRFACAIGASRMGYLSSKTVKKPCVK